MMSGLEAKTDAEERSSASSWTLFTFVFTVASVSSFRIHSRRQNASSVVENIDTSSDSENVSSDTHKGAASSTAARTTAAGAADSDVEESAGSSSVAEDVDVDEAASSAAAAAVARTADSDVEQTTSSAAVAEDANIDETSSASDSDAQQAASESLQSSGLNLDQSFVVVDLVLQLMADVSLSLHLDLVDVNLTGLVLNGVLVLVDLLGVRLKLLFVDGFVLVGGGDLQSELGDGSFVGVDAGQSDLDEPVESDDLVVVLAQQSVPLQQTSLDKSDLEGQSVDEVEVVDSEVGLSSELSSAVSELDIKVGQGRLVGLDLSVVLIAVFSESGESNIDGVDVSLGVGDLIGKSGDQSGVQSDLDLQLLNQNSQPSDVDLDSVEGHSEVGDEALLMADLDSQLSDQVHVDVDGSELGLEVDSEVQEHVSVVSDLLLVGVDLPLLRVDDLLVLSDLMTVGLDLSLVLGDSGGVGLDFLFDLGLRLLSLSSLSGRSTRAITFQLSSSMSQREA